MVLEQIAFDFDEAPVVKPTQPATRAITIPKPPADKIKVNIKKDNKNEPY